MPGTEAVGALIAVHLQEYGAMHVWQLLTAISVTVCFVVPTIWPCAAKAARPRREATPAATQPVVGASRLVASVRPYTPDAVSGCPATPRTERLLQACYDSIREWGEVLATQFRAVPGQPDKGYYGLGGENEDELRPITYAALTNAFLSVAQPPANAVSPEVRRRSRDHAIAALRYLTDGHVTGLGTCANGRQWGHGWQSAMWSRSTGLAGWLMWMELDDELKCAVARLVESEADRFLRIKPKSSENRDTGAEENAWNALILSLATNMLPEHPRAGEWDRAAKLYLYNTLSRAVDENNHAVGDDGLAIREWVTTVNAHPDCTVENHGLVHVGYLKLTVGEMLENGVHYLLTGRPVPQACFHNLEPAFDVLMRCMSWDGAPIYFGGNDWKIIHTQCTDLLMYASLSTVRKDASCALLEDRAIDVLRRIQQSEDGYYNVRRDLEYSGQACSRIIDCYLLHALLGEGATPASETELDQRVSGVTYLRYAQAVLHRTPTKFASFTWGPQRLGLALPRDGSWVVWPHFASYLGTIEGQLPSHKGVQVVDVRHRLAEDGFIVAGRLKRSGGVTQDFAFASLKKDVTVYIERIRSDKSDGIVSRETGIIGHTYPLNANERVLTGRHGSTRVIGLGGGDDVMEMRTDWLNLAGRVGYVVRRSKDRANVVRYHGQERGTGRVPMLQEYVSLVGDSNGVRGPGLDWACVVTFLNQAASETAKSADNVEFTVEDGSAQCTVGSDVVRIDFNTMDSSVQESPPQRNSRG